MRRQPGRSGVAQVGRHGGPGDHLAQRRLETAVHEHRRCDAARERTQLVDGLARLGQGAVEGRPGSLRVAVELGLGAAEVHREADQPLLRAVVDVALEATERHGLGRAPGPAAGLGSADLLLQLGPAAQEVAGQAGVEQRGDAEREREGQQRDQRRWW